MSRTYLDYLRDALQAMEKAQQFIEVMDYNAFRRDEKTAFAVARALEIAGEAVKQVPEGVRSRFSSVPWQDIAGMRDILVHRYFGVDLEVVWKTVTVRIPEVLPLMRRVIEAVETES